MAMAVLLYIQNLNLLNALELLHSRLEARTLYIVSLQALGARAWMPA